MGLINCDRNLDRIFVGIQARLNSKRLPLKCMLPSGLNGSTILEHIYLSAAKHFKHVYVLVPSSEYKVFIKLFRFHDALISGHDTNLLLRYQSFSNKVKLDGENYILRCTADNPLMNFEEVYQLLVDQPLKHDCYTTRLLSGQDINSLPFKGRNFDLFKAQLLNQAAGATDHELEHVIPYILRVSKSLGTVCYSSQKTTPSIDTIDDYISYLQLIDQNHE